MVVRYIVTTELLVSGTQCAFNSVMLHPNMLTSCCSTCIQWSSKYGSGSTFSNAKWKCLTPNLEGKFCLKYPNLNLHQSFGKILEMVTSKNAVISICTKGYSIAIWSHLQTCLLWLPEGAHNVLPWVDFNVAFSESASTYKCHKFTLLFTLLILTWLKSVCPGGGVCPDSPPPPPPVDRILDTCFWKYYLAPTSLRAVIICALWLVLMMYSYISQDSNGELVNVMLYIPLHVIRNELSNWLVRKIDSNKYAFQ